MLLFILGIIILVVSGLAALMSGRSWRAMSIFGVGGVIIGSVIAAVPAVEVLAGADHMSIDLHWSMPLGSFSLGIDPLSAFFILPIAAISALAAIYGLGYLRPYHGRKNLGAVWLFYNVLVASMLLTVTARNAVLFLVAWEVMALASFFLVMLEHEKESVRQAGWTYLVATHMGTAFLIAMFVILSRSGIPARLCAAGLGDVGQVCPTYALTTVLDFDAMGVGGDGRLAWVVFLLAVVGFGTKAGFMPMHVWLPKAHPAAPSHVSAVMSGVMIKTGIYGLLRVLTMLGAPQESWGYVLVGIGAVSGVMGVLFALAQHDLKSLLAYHSVENIGIITMGIGVGVIGQARGMEVVAALGFAGALLHVLNHAVFKGLLFLGAGAVLHGAKTAQIDQLGGLGKKMPLVGACFLVGSAAISGLPPFNGFVSEFLIYLGAFGAIFGSSPTAGVAGLGTIVFLGLIGGLAAACFAKAYGIVFLGEPRTPAAAQAHKPSSSMAWPMVVLAGLCLAIGLAGPLVVRAMSTVVSQLCATGGDGAISLQDQLAHFGQNISGATHSLGYISLGSAILLGLVGGLVLARRRLLRDRTVTQGGTWDCGYALPTPRMQYTASSFAAPLTTLFAGVLGVKPHLQIDPGLFPSRGEFSSHGEDVFLARLYRPLFTRVEGLMGRLRWLQHGQLQLYVLYIALTLLVLLVWKLG
jgi:formate hydrogenlyase subunit 3/multisubunit Na+/H+ antiporter MnhD subunit